MPARRISNLPKLKTNLATLKFIEEFEAIERGERVKSHTTMNILKPNKKKVDKKSKTVKLKKNL